MKRIIFCATLMLLTACTGEYASVTVLDAQHADEVCKPHDGWMYLSKEARVSYKCTSAPINVYCNDGNLIVYYAKGECKVNVHESD